MTISLYAENALDKIQYPFLIKILKLDIERMCLNTIRAFMIIPQQTFMFNSKIFKSFPLRSGTRQGCPL
jgi:hypothetical protein